MAVGDDPFVGPPKTATVESDPFIGPPKPKATSATDAVLSAAGGGGGGGETFWPGLKYIGGKLVSGFLEGANLLGGAAQIEMGQPVTPTANPDKMVFGTDKPVAPNVESRYGGAITQAIGQNPFLAATAPVATAGGALGGQAASDVSGGNPWATFAGGLVGGGLAGGIGALTRGLLGVGSVESLAKSLGVSQTVQEAGAYVQGAAKRWMEKGLPQAESEAFGPLDRTLPRTADMPMGPSTPLNNTETTLKSILKIGAEDQRETAAAKLAGGGAANKVWEILTGKETTPEVKFPTGPRSPATPTGPLSPTDALLKSLGPPATPTPPLGTGLKPIAGRAPETIAPMSWDTVRSLRSWIGSGMTDPILKNMGQQNLDRIYAALSEDLRGTAQANGAGDMFDAANAVSSKLRGIAEDHIGKVAQADTPEGAYKVAMSGANAGGTRLSVLRTHLGDAADELAAAHLLNTPKGWQRLSPEAKAQLVPNEIIRDRLDAAVKQPTKLESALTAGASIPGELIGEPLGELFAHHLGMDPVAGKVVGMAVGAGLPLVTRGAMTAIQHPSVLRTPIIGGMAAPGVGNELTNQQQ